jgi:hypothetical protein
MLRILKICALLIPFTVVSLTYAGPSKKIDPRPAPPELIAVEDALAGSDLIGLFYLDMNYAMRLEKILMGEGDSLALPTSTGKENKGDDSFFGFLRRSGLKPGESVDYIVGGFLNKIKKGGQVQVALGNFSVESVTEIWKKNKDVKQTQVNGRTAWLWSGVDKESCKPASPELMVVENHRLIIGDPEAVTSLLKRLDKPKAEKDLTKWRDYRKGKLFAFAVLVPKDLENVTQNGMARKFAQSAKEQMAPVTGVYGGGTITWKPDGIDLEVLFETANAKWNQEQRKKFLEWKKKTAGKIDPAFKTVKSLMDYLDLQATGEKIILQAKVNDTLVKDVGKVFQEGLDWFSSSLSGSISISGNKKKIDEQIIPFKEVNQYKDSLRPKDLDPFDARANPSESFITTTGPFGVRVKGISLNPDETGNIDLHLEVVSSQVSKMEINPFAEVGKGTGAWLRITHVRDARGRELLLDEPCGKDRNSKYATLRKGYRNIDVKRARKTPGIKKLIQDKPRWSNLTIDVLQGTKTVHLRRGILLSDIASIEGEIQLQLPADIIKKRVRKPFKNKVVETGGVRIKLKETKDNAISFTASGEVGHLLETRALNGSGNYLRGAGSSSSSLFLGQGVNKNKQFSGQPKTVEFVLAGESAQETYPFQFAFQRPTHSANQFLKYVQVQTQSRRAFLQKRRSSPKRKVCSRRSTEFKSGAFYFCLNENLYIRDKWKQTGKYVSGSFMVYSQDSDSITHNLSAARMTIEKVIVQDGSPSKKKTVPVKGGQFLVINSNYIAPLKGAQIQIEAGPVTSDAEHMTPVGFEGYLEIRLPRKLNSLRLDLNELGNAGEAVNGLKAKFTGIDQDKVLLEIEGPRETLVQLRPLDGSRKPLKQGSVRIKRTDSEKITAWQAEVRVPPQTRYMEIVYATKQDTWKVPFHMEKQSPSS